MENTNLKKVLACCSVAGLLAATVVTQGCSNQDDNSEQPQEKEISQQQSVSEDEERPKPKKPDGKEVPIRGNSG